MTRIVVDSEFPCLCDRMAQVDELTLATSHTPGVKAAVKVIGGRNQDKRNLDMLVDIDRLPMTVVLLESVLWSVPGP